MAGRTCRNFLGILDDDRELAMVRSALAIGRLYGEKVGTFGGNRSSKPELRSGEGERRRIFGEKLLVDLAMRKSARTRDGDRLRERDVRPHFLEITIFFSELRILKLRIFLRVKADFLHTLESLLAAARGRTPDIDRAPGARERRCAIKDETRPVRIVDRKSRRHVRAQNRPLDAPLVGVRQSDGRLRIFTVLNLEFCFGDQQWTRLGGQRLEREENHTD